MVQKINDIKEENAQYIEAGTEFKCKVTEASKRFYSDESNYGIYVVRALRDSIQGVDDFKSIPHDWSDRISIKGNMLALDENKTYLATLCLNEKDKWGYSYTIKSIVEDIQYDLTKKDQQKKFLASLFTERQVEAMYRDLVDPFLAFTQHRADQLVQVKGCKIKTVTRWMEKFDNTLPMFKLYTELPEYDFTFNQMKEILERYKGADLAVMKIKENPYCLLEVKGLGWKKVDKIVMSHNPNPFSLNRVQAFILYYLNSCGCDGNSYISGQELMDAMIDNLGEDLPDMTILDAITDLKKKEKLWLSDDKQYLGHIRFYQLACHIAEELKRLINADSDFDTRDWRETLKRIENTQGWEYTTEQLKGIETALENNVSIIIGSAGTGKSSCVAGVLEVLKKYSCITVALAGKAASHTALISGGKGATIHTLLGYPQGDIKHCGFAFHEEQRLDMYDIIIVDEISMIGANLWWALLRAIENGTKVIMLGDTGQLEAIGEGAVARDMIESGVVPVTNLTEIHRQAKKSGIITESLKIRKGTQIIAKDTINKFTFGELQDLLFDCYCDKSQTFYKIMQHFTAELAEVNNNIMDIQVIVPTKSRGTASVWAINQAIQELYNSNKEGTKKELKIGYDTGIGILREGDKVICVQNNRKLENPDSGEVIPIFNGNIGMIKSIDKNDSSMIVEFESGVVTVPKKYLRTIELAYAITVHKEQGSSAKHIIFGLDFNSYSLLTKQLVYTALTRAEKHCTVCCETNALRYAISQDGVHRRNTHLINVLKPTPKKCGFDF